MLKTLLAERFKLVVSHEKRLTSALVLEVAKKGPKLEKAEPGEAGTNTSIGNSRVSIDAHNTDMDSFARILSRTMNLPVVNRTGLQGIYDFKLQWTAESAGPTSGKTEDGISILLVGLLRNELFLPGKL